MGGNILVWLMNKKVLKLARFSGEDGPRTNFDFNRWITSIVVLSSGSLALMVSRVAVNRSSNCLYMLYSTG